MKRTKKSAQTVTQKGAKIVKSLDDIRVQAGMHTSHLTDNLKKTRVTMSKNIKKQHTKVSKNIKDGRKKVSREFRKAIPTSGDELGKKIDKKLTSSQKIWNNTGAVIFGQKALENLSHFSSYALGLVMMLLTDILLVFPTDRKSLAADVLISKFVLIILGLIAIQLLTYLAMKLMGSKIRFKVYFSTVNTVMFMSLLIVSIPLALIFFAVFATMGSSQQSLTLLFTMIPFYNYLIFGWSSETLSRLRGARGVLVALISLILILFLNLILPQIVG